LYNKKIVLLNEQFCEQYFTVFGKKEKEGKKERKKESKEMREKEKKKENTKRNLGLKIQGSPQEYGLVSYE